MGGAALAGLIVSCSIVGCTPRPVPAIGVDWASARQAIYDRTEGIFTSGFFYKPREVDASRKTFKLAPLIVQEIAGSAADIPEYDRIAGIELEANGHLTFHTDRPVVYVDISVVHFNNQDYDQFSYFWFYPRHTRHNNFTWRGCRMTLDVEGFPIIWEMLSSQLAPDTLFVSRSLERAAAAAFGPPLTGRRYSIETDVHSRPDVQVARTLDDGPQPMGPFVYLTSDTMEVMTLTCRCMPSQVRDLPQSAYYDLRPLSELGNHMITLEPTRFEAALRLPESF